MKKERIKKVMELVELCITTDTKGFLNLEYSSQFKTIVIYYLIKKNQSYKHVFRIEKMDIDKISDKEFNQFIEEATEKVESIKEKKPSNLKTLQP